MRFLAASWLVIGLAFFAARSWISILVFGEYEYTLAVMVALSLVPPAQALALTWAMGGFGTRPRPAAVHRLLGRHSVQAVWLLEILVLVLFFAAAAGLIDLPFPGRRVLELAMGLALLSSAGLLFLAGRPQSESPRAGRMVFFAAVSAVLGVLGVVSACGVRWSVLQRFAPLTALAFIVAGIVFAPLLLWAARVLGLPGGRPLEMAAVLAAAAVSATPVCFYLRPYLGPNWQAPMLVLFCLAAACVLTAAMVAFEPREMAAVAESRAGRPVSIRTGLAVWLVLVASYVIVWVGVASILGAARTPTLRALLEMALITAGQAVAVLLWIVVSAAARAGGLADLVPPRRWILLVVIEGVLLLFVWWRWPAGDGAYWTFLSAWSGLKGGFLGFILVVMSVRGARRSPWGVVLGLAVIAGFVSGVTIWHAAVWMCLMILTFPALVCGWQRGRMFTLAVLTPALLIAVPSVVLQVRPLGPAVAVVIAVGVLTTSVLFGFLTAPRRVLSSGPAAVVGP